MQRKIPILYYAVVLAGMGDGLDKWLLLCFVGPEDDVAQRIQARQKDGVRLIAGPAPFRPDNEDYPFGPLLSILIQLEDSQRGDFQNFLESALERMFEPAVREILKQIHDPEFREALGSALDMHLPRIRRPLIA